VQFAGNPATIFAVRRACCPGLGGGQGKFSTQQKKAEPRNPMQQKAMHQEAHA
jgi:hypothetical protein